MGEEVLSPPPWGILFAVAYLYVAKAREYTLEEPVEKCLNILGTTVI